MLPEWFGLLGAMRWPLAACAVLASVICLDRIVFIIQHRLQRQQHLGRLSEQLMKHKDVAKPIRDDMMTMLIDDLQERYLRGVRLLRLIGTMSPLLGLLGTILGIIAAFKVIAAHPGAISPNLIADGLWEAMLTTVTGLFIALPALLMAHGFRFFSDRELRFLCHELHRLSMSFDLQNTAAKP